MPQESLRQYYSDIQVHLESLGFEDIAVTQRHGLHPDAAAHFELRSTLDGGSISAYEEYRITAVILDLNRTASFRAKRRGAIAPKIRMKITEAPARLTSDLSSPASIPRSGPYSQEGQNAATGSKASS